MRTEEMRRNRKLWLMTRKGSTFAFDALGEVKDPIAHILKWANENLEDSEIRRLQTELGRIVEQGKDSDGLRALSSVTGDDEGEYSERGSVFTETKRELNAGAREPSGRYSAGARQAQDAALSYEQLTRGHAADAAPKSSSYNKLFPERRIGDEVPIFAKPVEGWS
jgi:hypothetical protein